MLGPDSTVSAPTRGLRRAGTRRVDIAICTAPDRQAPEQLRAIRERVSVGAVFGPAGASPRGFRVAADGTRLTVGALTVVFATSEAGLDPQISLAAG